MPGISIHVVDVTRGVVAVGMHIEVRRVTPHRAAIASGRTNASGLLAHPTLAAQFEPGEFDAIFAVADYYRSAAIALPDPPFLTVVHYRFGLADGLQHYHLPFKVTPWGYSCFRGGA